MGAPKGNLFALGGNGGRPPHYETAELFAQAVIEYLDNCAEEDESPTITGMCLSLGFCSRSSFDDYSRRSDEFSYVVKRAKMVVENAYEKKLEVPGTATGAIFALKNMGWKDRTETEHSGGMKLSGVNLIFNTQEGNEPLTTPDEQSNAD